MMKSLDELDSIPELKYGFSDSGIKVFSNVHLTRLHDWLGRLEDIHNQTSPFLKREQNLVVIDTNERYLCYLLKELLPEFMQQSRHERIQTDPLPHHIQPYFLDFYHGASGSSIINLYSRIKCRGSLTEKLTRKNAEFGSMGHSPESSPKSSIPYHILVEDAYAFTLVVKDDDTCFKLIEKFSADDRLTVINQDDYHTSPKENGYKALHKTYAWLGNKIPPGTVFEVHFETIDNHTLNQGKDDDNPRSYRHYGLSKFRKEHRQGNNQIVILEQCRHRYHRRVPIQMENSFADYILITY